MNQMKKNGNHVELIGQVPKEYKIASLFKS